MIAPASQPAAARTGALESVANSIRALILPSPALYCLCNQERLQGHWGQLAAVDAALEDLRKRAFAAATRLLSLDLPQDHKSGDDADVAPTVDARTAP